MNKINRLIRLQKLKVDQQRLFLQPLQQRIRNLENEVAAIYQHIKDEQTIAKQSIEGAIAYGQYIQGTHIRLGQVQRFLKEANLKLNQELQRLQQMAATQKVYEKIEAQEQQQHREQLQKHTQNQLDEKVPYAIKKHSF